MSKKGMVLFNSFSVLKLMEGSTLFIFSSICSIFMFWDRKRSTSSIYLKYVALIDNLDAKGQNTTKWVSHRETKFQFIKFAITFRIIHVSNVFAEEDQSVYVERWFEFNFS